MSDIHDHMKSKIMKHKHKFPATLYRGVAITEFNAEELRALICILGDMGIKGVDQEVVKEENDLPVAYNGCTCACHKIPGMIHCIPCCKPSGVTNRPETGRQHD